jgi:hypothetical protein
MRTVQSGITVGHDLASGHSFRELTLPGMVSVADFYTN